MMWYNIIFYSDDIIVNNNFEMREISSLFSFSINSLVVEGA